MLLRGGAAAVPPDQRVARQVPSVEELERAVGLEGEPGRDGRRGVEPGVEGRPLGAGGRVEGLERPLQACGQELTSRQGAPLLEQQGELPAGPGLRERGEPRHPRPEGGEAAPRGVEAEAPGAGQAGGRVGLPGQGPELARRRLQVLEVPEPEAQVRPAGGQPAAPRGEGQRRDPALVGRHHPWRRAAGLVDLHAAVPVRDGHPPPPRTRGHAPVAEVPAPPHAPGAAARGHHLEIPAERHHGAVLRDGRLDPAADRAHAGGGGRLEIPGVGLDLAVALHRRHQARAWEEPGVHHPAARPQRADRRQRVEAPDQEP